MSVVAFDVYGTLVDTAGIAVELGKKFGDRAAAAARLWREKQLETTFRRALMRRYVDFDVCTAQALRYVSAHLGVPLDATAERALLDAYLELPAFPDVGRSLRALAAAGLRLLALTNGTEHSVRALLRHAGLSEHLPLILSADAARTFKPDPAVYELLRRAAGLSAQEVWLVSANPFDVIGAKAHGLRAAWVQRDPKTIFDPWEFRPDLIVRSLEELREQLAAR
ncbi:MAG TPA: haloacid dehalogenase type II [Steroidobacteraceae bacterium]|nr:haloacid dehalogenase type II [Steroidobacteraceae bacterium]